MELLRKISSIRREKKRMDPGMDLEIALAELYGIGL